MRKIHRDKITKESYTVREFYRMWMRNHKEPVLRDGVCFRAQQAWLECISPEIGEMDLRNVETAHLEKTLDHVSGGYQDETKIFIKDMLVDLFNLAIYHGLVKTNPAISMSVPVIDIDDVILTEEQVGELIRVKHGTPYEELIDLVLGSGVRPEELFALRYEDFSLEDVTVSRKLVWYGDSYEIVDLELETGKRVIHREIIGTSVEYPQLKYKMVVRDKYPDASPYDLIFVTPENEICTEEKLNEVFKKLADEINMINDPLERVPAFSLHSLRLTYAARLVERQIKIPKLKKLLGLQDKKEIEKLYVRIFGEVLKGKKDRNKVVFLSNYFG